jgi:hypothetical protein
MEFVHELSSRPIFPQQITAKVINVVYSSYYMEELVLHTEGKTMEISHALSSRTCSFNVMDS